MALFLMRKMNESLLILNLPKTRCVVELLILRLSNEIYDAYIYTSVLRVVKLRIKLCHVLRFSEIQYIERGEGVLGASTRFALLLPTPDMLQISNIF